MSSSRQAVDGPPTATTAAAAAADNEQDEKHQILSLLRQLRDNLMVDGSGDNDDDAQPNNSKQAAQLFRQTQETLSTQFQPDVSMSYLAPLLFRPDGGGETTSSSSFLSRQDALSVAVALVQANPHRYLEPLSRAVEHEAVRLLQNDDSSMQVSTELLTVLVDQLSQSVSVPVSVHATAALTAICHQLGPSWTATTALAAMEAVSKQAWTQITTGTSSGRQQSSSSPAVPASTVLVRCASAAVDIALLGDEFFQAAMDSGATAAWTIMVQYDADPLLQMSILDLMEKLATTTPHHASRTQWLFSDEGGLLKTILHLAGGYDQGEPDPLLGGAALRIISALCRLLHTTTTTGDDDNSNSISRQEHLLTGFHQALHNWGQDGANNSDSDRLAMVDAISSFAAASTQALELVLNDPVTCQHWLSLAVAQAKLKAAILVSVARVLEDPASDNDDDDVNAQPPPQRLDAAVGMRLYAAVGQTNDRQDTTALLLSMIKSPLAEIRLGCYALLEAVIQLAPIGAQTVLMASDFLNVLLVRENETTKNGREAKYAIVQAILAHDTIKGLLADDVLGKLETYLAQGPHYSKARSWELATD